MIVTKFKRVLNMVLVGKTGTKGNKKESKEVEEPRVKVSGTGISQRLKNTVDKLNEEGIPGKTKGKGKGKSTKSKTKGKGKGKSKGKGAPNALAASKSKTVKDKAESKPVQTDKSKTVKDKAESKPVQTDKSKTVKDKAESKPVPESDIVKVEETKSFKTGAIMSGVGNTKGVSLKNDDEDSEIAVEEIVGGNALQKKLAEKAEKIKAEKEAKKKEESKSKGKGKGKEDTKSKNTKGKGKGKGKSGAKKETKPKLTRTQKDGMCILRANVDNMEFKTESVNQKLVYPIPVYVHTIEIEGFDEFAKLSLETRGMVNAQLISSEDMVIRANNKKVYADYVFIDRFYTMGDAAQETLMRQFSIDTLKRNLKTVLPTVGAQLAP